MSILFFDAHYHITKNYGQHVQESELASDPGIRKGNNTVY